VEQPQKQLDRSSLDQRLALGPLDPVSLRVQPTRPLNYWQRPQYELTRQHDYQRTVTGLERQPPAPLHLNVAERSQRCI
jgi:hypothetical protein